MSEKDHGRPTRNRRAIEELWRHRDERLISEMPEKARDKLTIQYGMAVVRRIPAEIVADLSDHDAREIARIFGRPIMRRKLAERPNAFKAAAE